MILVNCHGNIEAISNSPAVLSSLVSGRIAETDASDIEGLPGLIGAVLLCGDEKYKASKDNRTK